MNKQFKFTKNEENRILAPRPNPRRFGPSRFPARTRQRTTARPTQRRGPRRGKACARRQCMGTPERFGICYKLYATILLVYIFTDTPSELLVLSLATPPRPPAHTGATGLAPATHAGHPSPPHPKITSRHSPMRERKAQGRDTRTETSQQARITTAGNLQVRRCRSGEHQHGRGKASSGRALVTHHGTERRDESIGDGSGRAGHVRAMSAAEHGNGTAAPRDALWR